MIYIFFSETILLEHFMIASCVDDSEDIESICEYMSFQNVHPDLLVPVLNEYFKFDTRLVTKYMKIYKDIVYRNNI